MKQYMKYVHLVLSSEVVYEVYSRHGDNSDVIKRLVNMLR